MSEPSLDERVAALEREVARLSNRIASPDWRSTIGMFAGDPIMKEIIERVERYVIVTVSKPVNDSSGFRSSVDSTIS
jgi:hypothetical protein